MLGSIQDGDYLSGDEYIYLWFIRSRKITAETAGALRENDMLPTITVMATGTVTLYAKKIRVYNTQGWIGKFSFFEGKDDFSV